MNETLRNRWFEPTPVEWGVQRMKNIMSPREDRSKTGEEELLSVTINEGIIKRSQYLNDDEGGSRAESLVGYKKVSDTNLVNNIMKMSFRCLGISAHEGIVSPAYSVFTLDPSIINSVYLNYLLRIDRYIYEYRKLSKGIQESRMRLYDDYFLAIKVLVPPLEDQKLISRYLDKNTEQIDSLIEKIKNKISLLKEQRTSLINQCITKGLDPNVEMKDSGLEWIGNIPKHWEVKKGKYVLSIFSSGSTGDEVEENGVPLIKVNDLNYVSDGYYLTKSKSFVSPNPSLEPLPIDILIFPKRGMTIFTNKIVISKLEGLLDPNLMGLKILDGVNIKFIFNLIKNRGLGDICDQTTVPQINNKHIYPLEFQIPPLEEQNQIIDFIDKESNKIHIIMSNEIRKIDLYKEYRQCFISSVVTGKVRVTEDMI